MSLTAISLNDYVLIMIMITVEIMKLGERGKKVGYDSFALK